MTIISDPQQTPPPQTQTATIGPTSPQGVPLDNEIGLIFGRKGTGKTTLARSLTAKMKRVLILDTLGTDYGGGTVVTDAQSLREYYRNVREYREFCIIARPRDDALPAAFFALAADHRGGGGLWVMAEEADRYCGPHHIDPGLNWCLNYGRQFGISVVGCARRPASVHRTWTANADWIVVHQTQEPRDLEYLGNFMDTDGLADLPTFQWRRHGTSKLFKGD
jgi:hypothetical protein